MAKKPGAESSPASSTSSRKTAERVVQEADTDAKRMATQKKLEGVIDQAAVDENNRIQEALKLVAEKEEEEAVAFAKAEREKKLAEEDAKRVEEAKKALDAKKALAAKEAAVQQQGSLDEYEAVERDVGQQTRREVERVSPSSMIESPGAEKIEEEDKPDNTATAKISPGIVASGDSAANEKLAEISAYHSFMTSWKSISSGVGKAAEWVYVIFQISIMNLCSGTLCRLGFLLESPLWLYDAATAWMNNMHIVKI